MTYSVAEHITARINDGWYFCETCGDTGSQRWAYLHQFPYTDATSWEPIACD